MKLNNIYTRLASQECNKEQLFLSLYGADLHSGCNPPSAHRPLLVGRAQMLPLLQCAAKNSGRCVRPGLTHAIFHHHEAALISFKALAFKISWRVDTPARPAYIQWDAALVDVCSKERKKCSKNCWSQSYWSLKTNQNSDEQSDFYFYCRHWKDTPVRETSAVKQSYATEEYNPKMFSKKVTTQKRP